VRITRIFPKSLHSNKLLFTMIPAKKFIILLIALMTQGAVLISAQQTSTIDMIPFYLELSSNATSKSNDIEKELIYRTEEHLENIIDSKDDAVWDNVHNILLSIEEHSIVKENEEYKSTTYFVGTIEVQDSTLDIPSRKQIEDLQWNAFVGQAKLDYLSETLEESSDDLLKGVTNVQLNWTPPKTTNLTSILWSCAIGVVVAIVLIAGYLYSYRLRKCMDPSNSKAKSNVKHSKLRNDSQILNMAETGSISPNALDDQVFFEDTQSIQKKDPLTPVSRGDTIDVKTSMDMLAWKQAGEVEVVPFEAVDISRISKSDAYTAVTKGTVDVNNSIDMLAWKHKNDNIPFDANVTGISAISPNKTLHVVSKKFRSTKRTDSKYLSSNILSQHNEDRFKDHAKRSADKVHKKRTGGSSRR
jgi:hypothetical protein